MWCTGSQREEIEDRDGWLGRQKGFDDGVKSDSCEMARGCRRRVASSFSNRFGVCNNLSGGSRADLIVGRVGGERVKGGEKWKASMDTLAV